uniref:collagen-like triple helix repeat-containing protein n=1 Tax=Prevotella sp. TaxID=59823 RepID=UPI0040250F42
MIKTKIYTKPKNTGASGGGTTRVTRLQGIATEAEYASKAGRATEADKAKEAGSAQYAEQAGHAGTAGYATKAGEVDLSAEALDHFARKDQDETFKGKVGFKKDVNFEAAALFADVVTMLKKLKAQGGIETDYVRSANYDEDTQQGFGLSRTKNGGYRLSLSELEVWCKAIFHELEIRKLSYAGGNVYLSGAGSKIVHVEEQYSVSGVVTGWKCYLLADDGSTATQNLWRVKDQARCQSFNILEGKHEGVSNKSYWRLVTEVSTQPVTIKAADGTALYGGRLFDWVILSATDCMAGSDTPAAGDTIVLDGASEDATRQGVLMLESTGNGTPRIVGLRGVSSYTHEGKEVFVFSPGGSKIVSSAIEWVSSAGDTIHLVNYRGEWQKGVSYGHYDQVNHDNALWTCVNPNGCNSEPKAGTSDWQKVLSGEKGEQGAQGPKGETGAQGPQGEKGDQGEKGEQGIKGDKGEDGLDGADGADGLDGTDGISILIERPLVFDTDDTGKVPTSVLQSKKAVVRVMQGGANVSDLVKNLTIDNAAYCSASASVKTDQDSGSYIEVQLNSISDVQTEAGVVSAPCGFVVLLFLLGGNPYRVQVPFTVNIAKYMGSVKATAKQYQSKFEALENDLKGSNPTVLNAYTSTIKQTAKEITLSVTQSQQGRHNLLRDTSLTRKGDIKYSDGLFQPTITQGVNGHNAIRFSVTGDGTPQYNGLFWGRVINGIAVKKNTDYTFSAWIKCDTKDLQVRSEVFKMAAQNSGRGESIRATSGDMRWQTKENEVNQWRQVNYTFNTGDAEFIEVNIFVYNGITVDGTFGYTASGNGWICMPMLEEGSEYTGWTPAETDYDYVGGNLLEDTMTLTRSSDKSNLQLVSGLIMFEKYEGCYGILYNKNNSAESLFTEALQYKFSTTATLSGQARIVKKQDYVFSFVAKGSGNINVCLYGDSVHANVYTETCEGNEYTDGRADGYAQLALTSTYKRYWVHWRIEDYTGEGTEVIPDKVLIRVPGDTEAWVTKPKLEEGAQLTDYTERKTDLIDRATAKAAGLEITSSGVTLYGEKIKVENTLSTGQTTTAALFTDGAINAALILAQMLTSQGHNGQMVRIADGLINIYGKAGTANIRFGLNSSGQAVLSYYDDNGNFLYDLGPAGVASLSKTDAKITSEQYIKAEDAGLTTPLGENVDLPWVDTTKSWYTATKDNNYILFVKGATGKTTTLYRYSAPRVNGKIVADSANGLGTYALVSAADGRTFTSRTMVKNGALTNLADGVFLTADAKAYDNTKLVPSIKKGQSVTRPSFYVQIATFSAKYMTPAGHGRIYSIQTETTFGNLDVGIMSNNNY